MMHLSQYPNYHVNW